ncbi:MAG TPA: rRNA maturation RNase YbeY [Ferruginibacter sp.]|nr:rRNA maturation RNase YbeY [Ferruginibacter sp.]HRE63605.1 rRNA maturation RNase YbeY [Ferruginibacter sp.]
MPVKFNFQKSASLKNRQQLKTFLLSIFKREQKSPGKIDFIFCSDDYILQINKSFLNHDYYTDIITFDLSDYMATSIDAEIYISIDTVKSNSVLFNTSFNNELHRVIFHGILHLCGYNDKRKEDKKTMSKKEDYYLRKYKMQCSM